MNFVTMVVQSIKTKKRSGGVGQNSRRLLFRVAIEFASADAVTNVQPACKNIRSGIMMGPSDGGLGWWHEAGGKLKHASPAEVTGNRQRSTQRSAARCYPHQPSRSYTSIERLPAHRLPRRAACCGAEESVAATCASARRPVVVVREFLDQCSPPHYRPYCLTQRDGLH